MLTAAEKRFLRYWIEQREGGRASYYLLYISVGTFIFTLILSVFLFLFFNLGFGSLYFWIVFSGGLTISIITTLITWRNNERRFHRLIQKLRDNLPKNADEDKAYGSSVEEPAS